jgi:ankyrin repeat protein
MNSMFNRVTWSTVTTESRVNAQNRDGITPLISAVNGKQIKAAKFLLDAGSDTNFKQGYMVHSNY